MIGAGALRLAGSLEHRMGYVGVVEGRHSDRIGLQYLRFQRMQVSVLMNMTWAPGPTCHPKVRASLATLSSVFHRQRRAGCHLLISYSTASPEDLPAYVRVICAIYLFNFYILAPLSNYRCFKVWNHVYACLSSQVIAHHGDLYVVGTSNVWYLCETGPCFSLLRMGGKKVF